MTIPTRSFIEPVPGSALYEAEKAFKANIVAHVREQLNDMQDAKRSALRGGPCVALTQPLSRALIKYTLPERPFRINIFEIYRRWLVEQAWKEYLRSYQGSRFQGFLERP